MQGLVRVIRAVGHLITYFSRGDAFSILALELSLSARVLVFLAVELVAVVPTIVLSITAVGETYALEVLTTELRGTASLVLRVTLFAFIRGVSTVVVVITQPPLVDASAVTAGELVVAVTRLWTGAVVDRRIFICTVHAIWVSVTQPLLGDALRAVPVLVCIARVFRLLVTLPVIALMSVVLI
jgi:hypothetical protein